MSRSRRDSHPLVLAAKESEDAIALHLRNELTTAVRGIEVDLRLTRERTAMLGRQLDEITARLSRLASIRADYSTQVAETLGRTVLLERSEQRLSDARISQASAAASLISPIDSAEAGVNPLGPSRAVIVAAGIVGGLMTGIGIFLLTVQPAQPVSADSFRSPPADLPGNPPSSDGSSDVESRVAEDGLSLTEALDKLVRNRDLWG